MKRGLFILLFLPLVFVSQVNHDSLFKMSDDEIVLYFNSIREYELQHQADSIFYRNVIKLSELRIQLQEEKLKTAKQLKNSSLLSGLLSLIVLGLIILSLVLGYLLFRKTSK